MMPQTTRDPPALLLLDPEKQLWQLQRAGIRGLIDLLIVEDLEID